MAKSALPLILAGGAAALLLGGKKKKPKKSSNGFEKVNFVEVTTDPAGGDRMIFDQECMQITNKLNMDKHNSWLTTRYFELLEANGAENLDFITLQLLKEQSDHCPWDEQDKWTPLMRGLHDQLNGAVKAWHSRTGGQTLPG